MDTNTDGCQLTNHLAAIYIAAEHHTAAAQALENIVSHPEPGYTHQELVHDAATNEAEKHYTFKDLLLELAHEIGVHPADVMEAVNDYHAEEDAEHQSSTATFTDEQGDTYTTNSRY